MPAKALPRGIQLVEWRNKTTKAKQLRYRVQIKRKDFQADKLFDSLEEATEFLTLSKSKNGQRKLHEVETEKEIIERFIHDWMHEPTLDYYFDEFANREFSIPTETELQRRNRTNKKSLIATIKKTIVKTSPNLSGRSIQLAEYIGNGDKGGIEKPFGKLKIEELDDFVIDSFIRAHLAAGKKKSSIGSYLTMLNKFLSKLRFIDPKAYNNLRMKTVNNYDKDLLKNATKKNVILITDEDWQKILAAIFSTSNIQFGAIILLSLATGLRKSETVNLEWENIKGHYLDLVFTKSGKPRRVFLTQQARDIIALIDKRENAPRLFTYSIAGFSKMYRDLQIKHGFKHISFHQFRKNFISRIVEKYAAESGLFLSEILGISNVAKFERDYLEPARIKEIDSDRELLRQVGHSSPQITKDHYLTVKE